MAHSPSQPATREAVRSTSTAAMFSAGILVASLAGRAMAFDDYRSLVHVHLEVDFVPATGVTLTPTWAFAAAAAGRMDLYTWDLGESPCHLADEPWLVNEGHGEAFMMPADSLPLSAIAHVGSGVFTNHEIPQHAASMEVYVSGVSATEAEIVIDGWNLVRLRFCEDADPNILAPAAGAAWATGTGGLAVTSDGAFDVGIEGYSEPSNGSQDIGGALQYRFFIISRNGTPHSTVTIIESCYGSDVTGATWNSGTEHWEFSDSWSGSSGSSSAQTLELTAGRSGFDVNGDGRMNSLDADALVGLYSDPATSDWDLDGDGDIDEDDSAILDAMLANGGDQGILGDRDNDGDFDCDDYTNLVSGDFGFVLGDTGYKIALDANLDGQTDASDMDTILASFLTADFNHDTFVDPLDYAAFINAYEAPDISADFNRDGFVDPLDYGGFINAYENGC